MTATPRRFRSPGNQELHPSQPSPSGKTKMSFCKIIPSRIKDICLIITTFCVFYLLSHPITTPTTTTTTISAVSPPPPNTTIRHLLFSIASSNNSYPNRKPYLRLWYNPPSTRAFVFLDRPVSAPDSDPTLPPVVISADTSRFPYTFPRGLRSAIRVARIVKEAVELNKFADIRWYLFGDDDTVFFTENLVRVLSKYDHDRWHYIGSNSESYQQNEFYSFDMAFGGGGFAISSSLARVLARVLDSCLMRYPHLYGSDARIFSCLAELGVQMTHEPGFHQLDVRGDLFGMLSAHPLSPLLSLHHLEVVDPIFPGMSRFQAVELLFEAAKYDPARILQQTVCYDPSKSITVSVSWGYVVQVFQGNQFLPDLLRVPKTFSTWRKKPNAFSSLYMFNTRDHPRDPCKRPLSFFLEGFGPDLSRFYTYYKRNTSANCSRSKAIQSLGQIKVFSKKLDADTGQMKAPRRHCCEILPPYNTTMVIALRRCEIDELIAMRA